MSWQRIRGHAAVAEAFERAFRRGRLAHAYLFVGPGGVGKRLFAEELAKALLCETRPKGRLQACDHCAACKLVAAGTHPDYFTAGRPEDKANLGIDVVRELCRRLSLKPVRGRGKVAILDDADDLNDPITSQAAPTAFLKTLEEPPPGSLLILIGTSVDQQLPTVRSRCQVVRFDPLPEDQVIECLTNTGVESAHALRAARLSTGSPGQALALTDPTFWEFRLLLLKAIAHEPFDSAGLSRGWMKFIEVAGKDSAAQRRRAALALRLFVDFLEEALAHSVGRPPRRMEPEDGPALEAAARLGPDGLSDVLDRCFEADRQIERRLQLALVIEALLDAIGQKMRAMASRA